MPQIDRNLSTILATLRSAAGPRVLIVGMTYYVPELGLWHRGRTGRQIAILTDAVAAGANQMLVTRYRRFGARVADVFAAFRSSDFGAQEDARQRPAAGVAIWPERPARADDPPNAGGRIVATWMAPRRRADPTSTRTTPAIASSPGPSGADCGRRLRPCGALLACAARQVAENVRNLGRETCGSRLGAG